MRARVYITGRVQGVGYRYSTCRQARERSLTGWVRNLSDGAVEAEFQGPEDAVASMLAWCHQGPISADVTSVEVEPRVEIAGEEGFRSRG